MQNPAEVNKDSKPFKAGFVAVMGRPNVGKSTLVNALVGQKIAAVTPRPQTTRKNQMGILSLENAQVVFIDTPGVHHPRHKLGESMNQEALETLDNCDMVLFVVDVSELPNAEDQLLADTLAKSHLRIPIWLALNKSDLVSQDEIVSRQAAYATLIPQAYQLVISAAKNIGLDKLLQKILGNLVSGEPFFPEGQVTDLYEREIAADLIRESALIFLRDEVPHGIAIRIDQYTERQETGAYIEGTLFVEKESHKPIVIGQNGEMLKKIGTAARHEIETATGRKVFLHLRVKVRKNWRDDEKVLHWFGY
jgi:GTPase